MKRWIRNALVALMVIFPAAFITASYLEDLVETNGQEGSTQLVAMITRLPTTAINLAAGAGYGGIFLLMLLESASFPVPSEVILPLAGYLVFRGTLQFWPVVLYSTVASLLGSFVDFYLGVKLGTPLLTGQTKLRYIRPEHLKNVQSWFESYGPAAVALLRLVPAARVLISFPAGASRMSRSKFALCTLLGCLPWNITLVYVGWWLGNSWDQATTFFRYIDPLVYLTMVLMVLWIAWRIALGRRK